MMIPAETLQMAEAEHEARLAAMKARAEAAEKREKEWLASLIRMKDRIDAAEKERDHLREKLSDLLSWFPDKPTEPQWQLVAGEYGADDAIDAARAAAEAKP